MNLIEKLAAPPAAKSTIDMWVDSLDQPSRDAVLAAAIDTRWGHKDLFRTLAEEGLPHTWPSDESAHKALGKWRASKGWKR